MPLQDYYITGDDSYLSIKSTVWVAQIFTATASYSIDSIKVLVYITADPGTVTVSIRNVVGDPQTALPTGEDLKSGNGAGGSITYDDAGEWFEITLDSTYSIVEGNKYAICLRCSSAAYTLKWRNDSNAGYITGNAATSTDSGSSWSISATRDMLFETHSIIPWPVGTIAGSSGQSGALTFDTTGLIGSIAGSEGQSGAITFATTGISGTVAGILSGSGAITFAALALTGSIAGVAAMSGSMLHGNILSKAHIRTFKRLVAAGNNKIYYEDI